jgi:hypothetical protein
VIRPASAVFDLSNLLFSRILLRFPKLKVVLAESTIGWGTFLLEYADHQYDQDHCDYELKPVRDVSAASLSHHVVRPGRRERASYWCDPYSLVD